MARGQCNISALTLDTYHMQTDGKHEPKWTWEREDDDDDESGEKKRNNANIATKRI